MKRERSDERLVDGERTPRVRAVVVEVAVKTFDVSRFKRHPGFKDEKIAWKRLAAPLAEEGRELMPHEIANYLGVGRKLAQVVLFALWAEGLATLHLAVYHRRCSDVPVVYRRFEEGFQPAGECPDCGDDVESEGFTYDFVVRVEEPVRLVGFEGK